MSKHPTCECCRRKEATRELVWAATGERVWLCDKCYETEGPPLKEAGFRE